MSLQLVTATTPAPLITPLGNGSAVRVTDEESGLTCWFDDFSGGVLLRRMDDCCLHDQDEFRGAALLELAVAGPIPIAWEVSHARCARLLSDMLDAYGLRIRLLSAPHAA